MDINNQAIQYRNSQWIKNSNIPKWVNINEVDLDQFFTLPEIASYCFENFLEVIKKDGAKYINYKFIEPAAGACSFYDLFPKERRVGIDIMPMRDDIIKGDFLSWGITPNCLSYATVGNPPFGYRAWLALEFMNHAAKFSDYVGMILPMAFQSDGKGSPKHRVVGLELIHSEILPPDSFINPNGKKIKINALWQVWKRGVNNLIIRAKCSDWIDLFTVDMRKERLCGQTRLKDADFFLQRTYYNEQPNLVRSFSEVRYVCGYGIIIKKDRKKITDLLNAVNWDRYSNLAAHNCRHISMYHIEKTLTDAGYFND